MAGTSTAQPAQALILLGRRSGALRAAGRLGIPLYLLDEASACRTTGVRHHRVNFDMPETDWRDLALCLDLPMGCGVAALSERSVLAAACLRESLNAPGTDASTARLCRDKALMKTHVRSQGIPCARWATAEQACTASELVQQLGLPLVVKPRDSSGGRGMQIIRDRRQVPEELPVGWMAESFLPGREMSVESLLCDGRTVFTNLTEYWLPRWSNILPASLKDGLDERVEVFNRQVIEALGIRSGMTHLEIFLDGEQIIFGEIALRPPGGHLMELIEQVYGFDPWAALLGIESRRSFEVARTPLCHAGVLLLHPGAGRVQAVGGVEEVRRLPATRLVLKVRPGDAVADRLGAGQEAGHVIVVGNSRDEVVERLQQVRVRLTIELA